MLGFGSTVWKMNGSHASERDGKVRGGFELSRKMKTQLPSGVHQLFRLFRALEWYLQSISIKARGEVKESFRNLISYLEFA